VGGVVFRRAGQQWRAGVRPGWHQDRHDPSARTLLESVLRGLKRNRLFMTGGQSLYSLYVEAQGVPYA
jgi:hypothetical protein